jgi:U3 small nucleolar RNA-associated protein 21
LSQGSVAKKANALGVPVKTLKWNPIVRISSEATRSKDWEDVITMHEGDAYVRSWRLQEKKAGRWAMEIEDGSVSVRERRYRVFLGYVTHDVEFLQSICTSACGNYALAGSSIGQIRSWNLQSGQERKSFEVKGVAAPSKGKKTKVIKGKKTGSAITGMCTDALNNVLVASTLDGSLNVSTTHCPSSRCSTAHPYRRAP